jgi:hypothetical protein
MKNKITTRKKQKGGILLKMEPRKAFYFFVDNSKIELFTDTGTFGIILKATLNNNLESPYEMFGPNNFKQPVPSILIKLVALNPNKKKYNVDELDEDVWYLEDAPKEVDSTDNFIREVNVQTDIFFKTMEYLQPLCPAPVFSEIITRKINMENFLITLKERATDPYTKEVFDIMIKNISKFQTIPSLGVLGMEIADGFDTIYNYYNGLTNNEVDHYELCEQMVKLQILNLALKTGYSQNDFHRNNLLVNPNYKGFYKGIDGKVLIIDFGFASKINKDNLNHIHENYKEGNYSEALKTFETLTRSDGLAIKKYPTFYGWIYNNEESFTKRPKIQRRTDSEYDAKINELREKEEEATDDRIKYFDEKHQLEPEKYPLLPLSNVIKNSFFQGMIHGGDRKKKNRKTRNKRRRNEKCF